MLKLRLLILLLIPLHNMVKAQNIMTNGLKNQYRSTDKISYTIQYSLPDTVFVSIGLEVKLNQDWVEITDDISKKSIDAMRVEVMRLCNGGKNKIYWIPDSLPYIGVKSRVRGTFRFVYFSGTSINVQNKNPTKYYSPIFTVK